MPALHGAVALEQMHQVAVALAEQLGVYYLCVGRKTGASLGKSAESVASKIENLRQSKAPVAVMKD